MTKKKVIRKFWWIKRHFLRKSLLFFRKSAIFSRNFPKTYRNLTLGFLEFFYCPILGFHFFLSGNTANLLACPRTSACALFNSLFLIARICVVIVVLIVPFNFHTYCVLGLCSLDCHPLVKVSKASVYPIIVIWGPMVRLGVLRVGLGQK